MGKCILLNKLYTGRYLDQNIGHEIINFFKDDNGDNYLYITPEGTVASDKDVQMVLFLSHSQNQRVEVLAKAEIKQKIYKAKPTTESIREACKNIKYGGKVIYDIFDVENDNLLVTYKAGKIWKPKDNYTFYLTEQPKLNQSKINYSDSQIQNESSKVIHEIKHIKLNHKDFRNVLFLPCKTSPALNCEDNKDQEFFDFLNNNNYWEEYKTTKVDTGGYDGNIYTSILSLMEKENEEQIYTNLIASYFDACTKENKKVFEILFNTNNKYSFAVEKEHSFRKAESYSGGRIDILCSDKKHNSFYIFENKINSMLNGIIEISENEYISQLNTYENYIENNYNAKDINLSIIIICPDEKVEKLRKQIESYKTTRIKPEILSYGDLIKKFNDNKIKDILKEGSLNKLYYDEFMKILNIQTLSKGKLMNTRFLDKINN